MWKVEKNIRVWYVNIIFENIYVGRFIIQVVARFLGYYMNPPRWVINISLGP